MSPETPAIPTDAPVQDAEAQTPAEIPAETPAASSESAPLESAATPGDASEDDTTRDAQQRRVGVLSSKEQARIAVEAAVDRKALDLKVLDLAGISDFTDIFLICSGKTERQVKGIADYIVHQLREQKVKPLHIEGLPRARWVLLDYGGDMVVHVFHQETRAFYALERLWSDAPDLTTELVKDLVLEDDSVGTGAQRATHIEA